MKSTYLKFAGSLSLIAGLLHFAIMLGGPDWYRFFGAGEAMAQMAEQGLVFPVIATSVIGIILICWGFYAFSGAGLVPRFPFLRTSLVIITGSYLLRAFLGLILPFVSNHPQLEMRSKEFWLWSSLICLLYGIIHFIGLYRAWHTLRTKDTD